MDKGDKYSNIKVAELLRAVATAYELKDKSGNKFRIIAYSRAADAIEHLSSDIKDIYDEGKLADIPGVGESIAKHLKDLISKGRSRHFDSVMSKINKSIFKLVEIPGIGPKTAYNISKNIRLSEKDPIGSLFKACKKNMLIKIEGFGEDSQKSILQSIKEYMSRDKRMLLNYAITISEEIVEWLKKSKDAIDVNTLGSLRRKCSTIGDIDISVSSNNIESVLEHFIKYPKTKRVVEKGERTASIIIPNGYQIDIMVQKPDSYGALLQHFTGSKHHNIALREYARSLSPSLSISEYGIRNLENKKLKKVINEEQFYEELKMKYIPPELREDMGEIEASINNNLPDLINLDDVKSDLQIHSNFNIETSHDLGLSGYKEIVKKADSLGYEYIAFTDHNPSHGRHNSDQILEILKRKKESVEKLNYSLKNIELKNMKHVFNSLEIDIMPDGKLSIPDRALEFLDFCLISIHSSFRLSKISMTKRILNAFSNQKTKIFAHPLSRKINEREGIELNWDDIFNYCIKNNKWLEINADPMRLDLPDFLVKEAVKYGVKITLGTDAHHVDHMDNMKYGTYVAQRGWAEKKDIINSLNYIKFLEALNV